MNKNPGSALAEPCLLLRLQTGVCCKEKEYFLKRFSINPLAVCVLPLLLVGCAQQTQVPAVSEEPVRISYSVGPCYGTCPVYQVAIEADGSTFFNGERHALVKGPRQRSNGAEVFQTVESRLAQWRPAMGTSRETTDCDALASDLPRYTVIWTSESFQQAVLEHDTGCRGDMPGQLTETLKSLDGLLGVDAWVVPASQ